MLYLVSDVKYNLHYLSSGNLVNNYQFIHPDRCIDSHVLIIVKKGILHINRNGTNFDIKPHQFIILFANQRHYGYNASEGQLSYYWCHFRFLDPHYKIYSPSSLQRHLALWSAGPNQTHFSATNYVIPDQGTLEKENRCSLFMVQLIDTAKRENYAGTFRCHYLLSALILELGTESLTAQRLIGNDIPTTIVDMIGWIRLYYNKPLSVEALAEQYGYHPTYLSSLFKKYTGYPIISYINRTRIAISKNLLTGDGTLKVRTIARMCGFQDEKNYLKNFKKIEGITPTQYRHTFSQKSMNT